MCSTPACANGSAFNVISGYVSFKNGVIDGTAVTDTECDAVTVRSGAAAVLSRTLLIKICSRDGACAYAFDGGRVIVEGGIYRNSTSEVYTYNSAMTALVLNQANVSEQLIFVSGGAFSGEDPARGDDSGLVTSFMKNGCSTVWSSDGSGSGSFRAVKTSAVTAKLSQDGREFRFASLSDAFGKAESGDTVTLAKDLTLAESLTVPDGLRFTLDFDGHTLLFAPFGAAETPALQIGENTDICFKNGTLGLTEENGALLWEETDAVQGIMVLLSSAGDFQMDNMTVDGRNIAHNGNVVSDPAYLLKFTGGDVQLHDILVKDKENSLQDLLGDETVSSFFSYEFYGDVAICAAASSDDETAEAPKLQLTGSGTQVEGTIKTEGYDTVFGCGEYHGFLWLNGGSHLIAEEVYLYCGSTEMLYALEVTNGASVTIKGKVTGPVTGTDSLVTVCEGAELSLERADAGKIAYSELLLDYYFSMLPDQTAPLYIDGNMEVIIEGGTIRGETKPLSLSSGTLTISGGTFPKVGDSAGLILENLDPACTVRENADGSWTVVRRTAEIGGTAVTNVIKEEDPEGSGMAAAVSEEVLSELISEAVRTAEEEAVDLSAAAEIRVRLGVEIYQEIILISPGEEPAAGEETYRKGFNAVPRATVVFTDSEGEILASELLLLSADDLSGKIKLTVELSGKPSMVINYLSDGQTELFTESGALKYSWKETEEGEGTVTIEVSELSFFDVITSSSAPLFSYRYLTGEDTAMHYTSSFGELSALTEGVSVSVLAPFGEAGTDYELTQENSVWNLNGYALTGNFAVSGKNIALYNGSISSLSVSENASLLLSLSAPLTAGTMENSGTVTVLTDSASVESCELFGTSGAESASLAAYGTVSLSGVSDAVPYLLKLSGEKLLAVRGAAKLSGGDGSSYYETLKEALNAAEAYDEVLLLNDAEGDALYISPAQLGLTLDLGGHTYTVNSKPISGIYPAAVCVSANRVTLKNGGLCIKSYSDNFSALIQSSRNVTIDGLRLDGLNLGEEQYVIYISAGNAVLRNTEVLLYTTTAWAINTGNAAGSVELTDCSFTGNIELTGGSLRLTGGSFADQLVPASGVTSFSVTKSAGVSVTAPEGYFWDNETVLTDKSLAEAKLLREDGSERWFSSFAEAFAAAEENAALYLLANCFVEEPLENETGFTLDLNGYGLYADAEIIENKNGTLTILDGSEEETGMLSASVPVNAAGGQVRILSGTVYGSLAAEEPGEIRVFGGSFSENPGQFTVSTRAIALGSGDGLFRVVNSIGAAASVDGVKYRELQLALDLADGQTVTLLKSLTDVSLTVVSGNRVTLKLNGKSLSNEGGTVLVNCGTLTVEGTGTVSGTVAILMDEGSRTEIRGGDFSGSEGDFMEAEGAKLLISGGTFSQEILREYCAYGFCPIAAAEEGRYTVTDEVLCVATWSSVNGESGHALLQGGDIYAAGETVVLTAHEVEGFTFKGWALKGCEESCSRDSEDAMSYTFTVTEDEAGTTAEYVAVYEADPAA